MNDKDREKTLKKLEARVTRLKAKLKDATDALKARAVKKRVKRAQRRKRFLSPPKPKKAE